MWNDGDDDSDDKKDVVDERGYRTLIRMRIMTMLDMPATNDYIFSLGRQASRHLSMH